MHNECTSGRSFLVTHNIYSRMKTRCNNLLGVNLTLLRKFVNIFMRKYYEQLYCKEWVPKISPISSAKAKKTTKVGQLATKLNLVGDEPSMHLV